MSLTGILLIGAIPVYWCFWLWRPIGTGPVGPPVPSVAFKHVWSEKSVWLVGIGDSVTAGFGSRPGYSYFARLVTNPPDEFEDMRGKCLKAVLPHLRFTNLAVSGSTSGEQTAGQLPRLPAGASNDFGLVVITSGGNDLIHNYGRSAPREQAAYGASLGQAGPWITNFEQRLELMIDKINAHFPGGCMMFLATIFNPTDGGGDIEHAGLPHWKDGLLILNAYNAAIRRCAQRHPFVHVVDVHDAFLGHGIHCAQFWSKHFDRNDPHYWYYVNLEDPNERGYDAMRRLFLLQILSNTNAL